MVKGSQYVELANDLEINKAITYLRQRDFKQVDLTLRHTQIVLHLTYSITTEESHFALCLCGTLVFVF